MEVDVAGILRTAVLVNTVSDHDSSRPQKMVAESDRNRVRKLYVRGRRRQSKGRPLRSDIVRDADTGNAVVVWTAIVKLLELEAVVAALPQIAVRRNVLRSPTGVGPRFVHDVRRGIPCFRNQEALPWTHAQSRRGRKNGAGPGRESAEGINQLVVIVNPAAVERVLFVQDVIEADNIFAVVERIVGRESNVVANRSVREACRLPLQRPVHVRDGAAIRSNQARNIVVRNGSFRAGVEQLRLTGKVSVQQRIRGDSLAHGSSLLPEPFPLFADKEKELVFENRSAQVIAEIVEPQLCLLRGEEVAGIKSVVAEELKGCAMDLVRSVFRHDVESGTGHAAVLGGKVRGFHLHFLNELRAYVVHQAAVAAGNQVERSVNGQVVGIGPIPIDRLGSGGEAGSDAELVGIGHRRAGHER